MSEMVLELTGSRDGVRHRRRQNESSKRKKGRKKELHHSTKKEGFGMKRRV